MKIVVCASEVLLILRNFWLHYLINQTKLSLKFSLLNPTKIQTSNVVVTMHKPHALRNIKYPCVWFSFRMHVHNWPDFCGGLPPCPTKTSISHMQFSSDDICKLLYFSKIVFVFSVHLLTVRYWLVAIIFSQQRLPLDTGHAFPLWNIKILWSMLFFLHLGK